MKIAYIRVSTTKQSHQRQIDSLEAVCDELHIETISANSKKRPIFDAIIENLKAGDTLVVHDLDRAFRSSVDALLHAEMLKKRKVNFQILSMNLDTNSEHGKLIYSVFAAFAQYERDCLAKRTREGMASIRKQGKHMGRLSNATIAHAHAEIKGGCETIASLALKLGCSVKALKQGFKRLGLE